MPPMRWLATSSVPLIVIVPVATSTSGRVPITVTVFDTVTLVPAITHQALFAGSSSHIGEVPVLMFVLSVTGVAGGVLKQATTMPVP
jgi:hypothetical protein